jgi:hypothetical protein
MFDSLVAGANDPVAVAANRAELRSLISPLGFRAATRIRQEDLRQLSVPTLMIWATAIRWCRSTPPGSPRG